MQERAFGPVAILSRAVATAVALAVASLLLAAPPAVAYETFGTYHLTYGIVNQLYWVDATASDHEGGIDTGIPRWNGTSTPFAYTQTSAKASSRMDFYKMSTVQSWWGKTYKYVNTTQLAAPPNQNWWWL